MIKQNSYTVSIIRNFGNILSFTLSYRQTAFIFFFLVFLTVFFTSFGTLYFIKKQQFEEETKKNKQLTQQNNLLRSENQIFNNLLFYEIDYKITFDDKNNLFVAHLVNSDSNSIDKNLVFYKFNKENQLLLKKSYKIPNAVRLIDVAVSKDGILYFAITSEKEQKQRNILVIGLNYKNEILNQTTIQSQGDDIITGMSLDKNQNINLSGYTTGRLFGNKQANIETFVIQLEKDKSVGWKRQVRLNDFQDDKNLIHNLSKVYQKTNLKEKFTIQDTQNEEVKNQNFSVYISDDIALKNVFLRLKSNIIQTGYTFVNNKVKNKGDVYISFVLVNSTKEQKKFRSVNLAELDEQGKPVSYRKITKISLKEKTKKYYRELRLQESNEFYNEIHFQIHDIQGKVLLYEIIEINDSIFFEN